MALIGYGGEEATAGDVISEHLLTFENVAELQTRNAQLLKVVRKLSQEQEQAEARARAVGGAGGAGALVMYSGGGAGTDSDPQAAMALGAALQELQSLRETRQRTEELVKTLVQQRDLYKAMLDEADTTIAASATAAASGSPPLGGPRSPPLAAGGTPRAHQQAQELQRRLLQVEDERNRARDRMSRLEEAERLVNERLEKAHAESVALRVEAAQATSEARFQRERAERLEETLKSVQSEVSAAAQRRLDMERLLVESQKDARAKDELLLQAHEALRTAQVNALLSPTHPCLSHAAPSHLVHRALDFTQDAARRAEIELEVTKAAEGRLLTQLADAREEARRQASLGESMRRIEAGLTTRVEEEKTALAQVPDRGPLMYALSRPLSSLYITLIHLAQVPTCTCICTNTPPHAISNDLFPRCEAHLSLLAPWPSTCTASNLTPLVCLCVAWRVV